MNFEDFKLINAIGELHRKMRRHGDRTLKRLGLTGNQGHILCYILIDYAWGREIRQRDIEDTFNIKASTVSGALKRLESIGMIQRLSDGGDARIRRIVPTDKARKLQPKVFAEAEKTMALLRSRLTDEEIRLYIDLCHRIAQTVDDDKA